MQQVTAAGGVVYRQAGPACEILLIFRNGLWDLPKGKKEEGESVEECARREVAEETGIPLPEVDQRLAETYHEYQRGAKKYGKTTHWFSMKSTMEGDFTPQKAEGICAVQWAPLNEALEMVGFKNLKEVLVIHQKSLK